MKVFLLLHRQYGQCNPIGVFSTKEKAIYASKDNQANVVMEFDLDDPKSLQEWTPRTGIVSWEKAS